MTAENNNPQKRVGLIRSVDWVTILLYMALLGLGWMSVCGATYYFDQAGNFFDFSTRSGMQIVWIGSSLILGMLILMTDDRLIESLSYLLYLGFIVLLFVTPFLAHNIKGSLSWIKIGSFSIQPAEFAKFATALCVARVMGTHGFNVSRLRDFLIACAIFLLPMALIVLQKETGSALVYMSFFLMLYREGMPGSILFAGLSAVVYFVVGVRFADLPLWASSPIHTGPFLVLLFIQLVAGCMLWIYTSRRSVAFTVLFGGLGFMLLAVLFSRFVIPFDVVWVQLAVCLLTIVYLLFLALRDRLLSYFYIAMFALGSLAFHYSADFVLNHVMEPHQQTRIRVLLGLEDDPRGAGYNVIQAKIAIGSSTARRPS